MEEKVGPNAYNSTGNKKFIFFLRPNATAITNVLQIDVGIKIEKLVKMKTLWLYSQKF